MFKKLISITAIVILTLFLFPTHTFANSNIPIITSPKFYEDTEPNTSLAITWQAPSSGTVTKYRVSVRELKVKNQNTNILIVDAKETTSSILIISGIRNNGLYRASVAAIMSDGSIRWSDEHYFFGAMTRGIEDGKTISFKIWNGFTAETKNAIYYSTRQWIDAMGIEKINTYPFNQGVASNALNSYDNKNTVVYCVEPDSDELMTAYARVCDFSYTQEVNIVINKHYAWSNDVSPNTYDVQNVMTHEMGHALGLTDKYETFSQDWTMYGQADVCETLKRSLTSTDIQAATLLY